MIVLAIMRSFKLLTGLRAKETALLVYMHAYYSHSGSFK